MKPVVETRNKIKITDPSFKHTLYGNVTDDIFRREDASSDFVACAMGQLIEYPDISERTNIEIEPSNDPM